MYPGVEQSMSPPSHTTRWVLAGGSQKGLLACSALYYCSSLAQLSLYHIQRFSLFIASHSFWQLARCGLALARLPLPLALSSSLLSHPSSSASFGAPPATYSALLLLCELNSGAQRTTSAKEVAGCVIDNQLDSGCESNVPPAHQLLELSCTLSFSSHDINRGLKV